MTGASLAFTGGAVLLSAGPAAATPGTTCTSGTGTVDLSAAIPFVSVALTGCGNRDATLTAVVDPTGGVQPMSIAWSTGKAASVGTAQIINIDFTGADCPAGNIGVDVLTTITGGVYGEPPTAGVTLFCADLTDLTAVVLTSSGPVNL